MNVSPILTANAQSAELTDQVAAGVEVLAGAPIASVQTLEHLAGVEVGLWEMSAGTVVRLRAGEQTEWTVAETLRKLWVSP